MCSGAASSGSARSGRARVEREFDFVIAVEDVVVRGQIDLWFEEGGELVIVDYKTDAVNGVEAHQRARDYAMQVRLYAMAVERVAGRPPDRAWLHFLRPDKLVPVDVTPRCWTRPSRSCGSSATRRNAGFPAECGRALQELRVLSGRLSGTVTMLRGYLSTAERVQPAVRRYPSRAGGECECKTCVLPRECCGSSRDSRRLPC